jgi:hypothetical protein
MFIFLLHDYFNYISIYVIFKNIIKYNIQLNFKYSNLFLNIFTQFTYYT